MIENSVKFGRIATRLVTAGEGGFAAERVCANCGRERHAAEFGALQDEGPALGRELPVLRRRPRNASRRCRGALANISGTLHKK